MTLILFGLIFVSFPVITSTLFFRYTSVYYGLAILLSVLAAWTIDKFKYGFIFSIICTALSLGIYQAYLPFTISLLVLKMIQVTLDEKYDFITLLKKGIFYCACLIGGLIVYYIGLNASLRIYDISLSNYQGISDMGKLSFTDIPLLIGLAVKNFIKMPIENYCQLAPTLVIKFGYIFLGILSLILLVYVIYKKKISIANILMLIFLIFCFALSVNFITVMCPNSNIYTLMVLPFVSIFIFPLILLSYLNINLNALISYFKPIILLIYIFMLFNYIYINNYNYVYMYYMNAQTKNYINSLITQIRMTDNFDTSQKWAFVGNEIKDPLLINIFNDNDLIYGGNGSQYYNYYSRDQWIRAYFGYKIPIASESEIEKLQKNGIVQKMPCWPNEGSIKVIDENVVVKFENLD